MAFAEGMKIKFRAVFVIFFLICFFAADSSAHAATLSLSPPIGTFSVGSTFNMSILLDTTGQSVNALSSLISFPPDMLQVVSPSLGQSVVGVWTNAPKFDNVNGTLSFEGGIPDGIVADNALVSTITFRVKSVGTAIVKFIDPSKVLANDGLGTNVLSQTTSAIYSLQLPPPEGPAVVSPTDPDQSQWYQSTTTTFSFASDSTVQGYSYTLSDDPTTVPDDISQGTKNSVTYTNLSGGVHFFCVKALRDGVWGGTTDYSVKIDSDPPALFKINISPSMRTSNTEPVIQFSTTDALSGIDHYEMKIIPLSAVSTDTLFAEVTSPYISPTLALGDYDVSVRAFDKAGNYREVTQRLYITAPGLSFFDDSGIIFGDVVVPWIWALIILLLVFGGSAFVGYRVRRWHSAMHAAHTDKKLPQNVASQLEELKKYRAKYGAKTLVIIFCLFSIFLAHSASAQTSSGDPLSPPTISTISKNISNAEIFYLGGTTDVADEDVVIYVQNIASGSMLTETATSDKDGNWFYRSDSFLAPGTYRLWVQGKIAEELSPPGPQTTMTISRTAIQFGSNRLSYKTVYIVCIFLLILGILFMIFYIVHHYRNGRKKRALFLKQTAEAEESIRRGFAVLRRDIEQELLIVRKASAATTLSAEDNEKESALLRDLAVVQEYVGKELWEVEHL